MPRKRVKAWRDEDTPSSRRNPFRRALHGVITLLIIAAILYVSARLAVGTAGFRSLAAGRMEKLLGMPVKIEQVSANWRFDVTLRNVVTEGTRRDDSPGLRAQRVRIGWAWGDLWRRGRPGLRSLELDRCVIVFARDEKQEWAPREFAPLSAFLSRQLRIDLSGSTTGTVEKATGAPDDRAGVGTDAAGVKETVRNLQDRGFRFALRRGEITWWDGADVPRAAVEGVDLNATPVRVPHRTLTHYLLRVERAADAQGMALADATLELLDTGDQQLVLVFRADALGGSRR